MLSVDILHCVTIIMLALFIIPVVILVSIFLFYFLIDLFHNLHEMADHDHDPTQYNPRWQALEETYFDWRCIVCCMVALSLQNLENQHIPGTESVYFDLDNTPWVKCDKCHTPFHLQCGTWESLQVVRNKHFLCTFFCCRQF